MPITLTPAKPLDPTLALQVNDLAASLLKQGFGGAPAAPAVGPNTGIGMLMRALGKRLGQPSTPVFGPSGTAGMDSGYGFGGG